jgi:uncharacterized repeat protein (TIGR03803 family)
VEGWTEKVLYSFKGNRKDGVGPSAGLIFDGVGNLYGTTGGGGVYNAGTVFELMTTANGNWTERVLHSFKFGSSAGWDPDGGLILDNSSNLYGTAGGGVDGDGVVFELARTAGGHWVEKVLHTFRDDGKDGRNPVAGLIFDDAGNLYGTTPSGGAYYGGGTVFELTPKAGGGWSEKILHSFDNSGHGDGRDGLWPFAGLILDAQGNLYGTTSSGGNLEYCGGNGCGTVFELSPRAGGHDWREKILHNFRNNGKDGTGPAGNLIFDAAGKLYGLTPTGGAYNGGTAYELSPTADGGWTEKVLHSFGYSSDGINPSASLVCDFAGNLYGTTWQGGSDEWGTVFEIMP